MSDKEKYNTKKLIQNIDLERPTSNFTKKVMAKVNIIPDDALLKDEVLTSLLEKNSLESPKADFSSIIMEKLTANVNIDYKPIISKKSWNVIFLIFIGSIVYLLFFQPNNVSKNNYVAEISNFFNKLTTELSYSFVQKIQVPSILIVSILSLTVLLFLDAVLRSKKFL